MATLTVNTDGGGDYTSLSAAEAALPATLTEPYLIECSGATADGPTLDIGGWSGYSVTILGNNSTGLYDETKYKFSSSGRSGYGAVRAVSLTDECVFRNVQFEFTGTTEGVILVDGGFFIDGCILREGGSGTGRIGLYHSGVNQKTYNTVIYGFAIGIESKWGGNAILKNNTMYNTTDIRTWRNGSVENCIFAGASGYIINGGTTTGSNNISSDATAPGTNSLINQLATDIFTDAANGNFTLKAGSPAIGAGTDLSATFTTDITGATRTTPWDIGAFKYISVGGTTYQVTCADGVYVAELVSKSAVFLATASDSMSAVDSDSNRASLSAVLADGFGLSDTTMKTLIALLTASDGILGGDGTTKSVVYRKSSNDGILGGDGVSINVFFRTLTSDSVSWTDAASLRSNLKSEAVDDLQFSDGSIASLLGSLEAVCYDGLSLGDSLSAVAHLLANLGDGLKVSDASFWGAVLSSFAADGIVLSENVSRGLKLLLSCSEGVKLSDSGQPVMFFTTHCSDIATFTETLASVMKFAASVSDGFDISETTSYPLGTVAEGKVRISFQIKGAKVVFDIMKPEVGFTLN